LFSVYARFYPVISWYFWGLRSYRVCHGFRLTKRNDYFWVDFDHFWIEHYFWRQLGIIDNLLEPKTKLPSGYLACPNPWNALYDHFRNTRANIRCKQNILSPVKINQLICEKVLKEKMLCHLALILRKRSFINHLFLSKRRMLGPKIINIKSRPKYYIFDKVGEKVNPKKQLTLRAIMKMKMEKLIMRKNLALQDLCLINEVIYRILTRREMVFSKRFSSFE